MTRRIVASIPPGLTLDAAISAMNGMGGCYPKHTLSLTNLPDGSMAIVHDPNAQPVDTTGDHADQPQIQVALGDTEPGDLIAYAMTAAHDGDHQTGLAALATGLAAQLEAAGAANYLTYTITHPDAGSYAVTIQRVGAIGPAEKIAALEARLAEHGEVTGREVTIRTVDPGHLRGLEAALGIRTGVLDGFRRAWPGEPTETMGGLQCRRMDSVRLDRQVDLDTAIAYARQHGLRYLEVRETAYDSGA